MFARIPELFDDLIIRNNVALRVRVATWISPPVAASIRRRKFVNLVRFVAARSPFYRRRFREIGLDIRAVRGPEDLGTFCTTAQDLRDNPIEEFLCGRPELAFETT